ncbi:MAG: peptidoglycan-binding protein, partial [Clostridia bacterium]|nr:peptidoglycan-binding protein [Clostridia bacterium]
AVSTGYYGALTSEAMRQFEENNGLYPDGYASDSDLRVLFSAGINRAKQQ